MTDISTLAASLMTNFITIRFPRCDRLWERSVPDPSPKLRSRWLSNALAAESLIIRSHRQCLRLHLLEHGHRAFFDRIEGCGREGWRVHFWCLDPASVEVFHGVGIGQYGPGDPARFDPEKFVMHRLRQLERAGRLTKPDDWWLEWDSWDE